MEIKVIFKRNEFENGEINDKNNSIRWKNA
jgi:hypothetical protein